MDKAKETAKRKPKTTVERLKEKNLFGLFGQLEVKHLDNIINEAKNAIPKVKEKIEKEAKEKQKQEQLKAVAEAKKLGIDTKLFAELSGATETHTSSNKTK
jgi:hypothetical protein